MGTERHVDSASGHALSGGPAGVAAGPPWQARAAAVGLPVALAAAGMLPLVANDVGVATITGAAAAMAAVAIAAVWGLVVVPARRAQERERRSLTAEREDLARLAAGHRLEIQLHRALEIAEDEPAALRVAEQALSAAVGQAPAQIMLAEAGDAREWRVVTVGEIPEPACCTVPTPQSCPTVRRGQGVVFEDAMALSACTGLKGRVDQQAAAVCTPITVDGQGVGMVRALGRAGDPMLYQMLGLLNSIASQLSVRLGVIRSVVSSRKAATIDSLTGLLNRAAMESTLSSLMHRGEPVAFVLADIDFFKRLNDTHGHDMGDRALRLFADLLQQSVRQADRVCRFGGEEFAVLLPQLNARQAQEVMERVRAALPVALKRASLPAFTFSAGIADATTATSEAALARQADQALYQAKDAGRDRIVLAPEDGARDETTPAGR